MLVFFFVHTTEGLETRTAPSKGEDQACGSGSKSSFGSKRTGDFQRKSLVSLYPQRGQEKTLHWLIVANCSRKGS